MIYYYDFDKNEVPKEKSDIFIARFYKNDILIKESFGLVKKNIEEEMKNKKIKYIDIFSNNKNP